ncbi:MAG: efflux RND transporter periplasmic adaptor subunit [Candidatus Cloacimonetes bacterium]|nr:efflux RND transporter periplasmic adaptor subunit [Candidatus Cloacimonadota bacterium]MCF7813996.1 efflux RND transporter periplasmic adaptor subunit [Candidatus Cloacimonadota bacterium]MCF7868624.1 efflux RND transporter periplasmic adaptor subunit [Candidatus Cloacimonadota bacterium]MCF7882853.1 efflux RND transporter periplasmic adaptor subunit [Candidatus Cloacimonadota bacterium]
MLKRFLIIGILTILVLSACQEKTETVEVEEFVGKREVKVEMATQADISSYIEFSGKLIADETVNISPSLSAKIQRVLVDEGRLVNKGDLLAKLDDTQLKQAKTQFAKAEKNYKRMQELKKTGAIDGATYDEVETAYKMAKTNLEFMAENTNIEAPMNGIITNVYKKTDENYDAMMDPFFIRMVKLDQLKANIQVSDADINSVKMGQKAVLNVNNCAEDFWGKVTFISPEADMMSGTFLVEITVANKADLLRNNQFARVKLLTETSYDTVIIPQLAVLEGKIVFTISNDKAVKNVVELGIENEYQIEVISGVEAGDKVVTVGNIGLSNGDLVEIIK